MRIFIQITEKHLFDNIKNWIIESQNQNNIVFI